MRFFILLYFLFFSANSFSIIEEKKEEHLDKEGLFSGRISRVNEAASLVRIKLDFVNMKYLNKRDKIEFWDVHNSNYKCKSYILGKTGSYILLKIPDYTYCKKFTSIGIGSYLRIFSPDLVNNIKMGRELVSILLKKRLAIHGLMTEQKKQLDAHIEKINAINSRYVVLREKLEAEWRDELAAIEEDRINYYKRFKGHEIQLNEINHKLEKYRIEDENLENDRWALDSRLFFQK